MPKPSLVYIFDNTTRRNRFALFVGVVLGCLIGLAVIATS